MDFSAVVLFLIDCQEELECLDEMWNRGIVINVCDILNGVVVL